MDSDDESADGIVTTNTTDPPTYPITNNPNVSSHTGLGDFDNDDLEMTGSPGLGDGEGEGADSAAESTGRDTESKDSDERTDTENHSDYSNSDDSNSDESNSDKSDDDQGLDSDFKPFKSKVLAALFILLFGCRRRMSIEKMKVLWVIFKVLDIGVPSLKTVLTWRKKIGAIEPKQRDVRPGVSIYVRSLQDLVRMVFQNPELAAAVQRAPKQSSNPKEMYESAAFSRLAPQLYGDWNGTRLYKGVSMTGVAPPIVSRGSLSVRANGLAVVNFPIVLSSDETSGNKTKRYNRFESVFAFYAALPKAYHTSSFINFAVLEDLTPDSDLSMGLRVWDCHTKQQVIIVSNLFAIVGDNPRHYQDNVDRSLLMGIEVGKGQIWVRQLICTEGDASGPLSLGVIKYAARKAKLIYQKKAPTVASKKLQSAVGLLFAAVSRYKGHHAVTSYQFMWHIGSMNAKDFKSVAQISPFLYPWFDPEHAATTVQKLLTKHYPDVAKTSKIHLLSHMETQFKEFSPLPLYDVEVPEHKNGDVREFLVNSNRKESSRDTANNFSVSERVFDLLRGGGSGGCGLQQLSQDSSETLKLDSPKSPNRRVTKDEFVFFQNWTMIGLVGCSFQGQDETIAVDTCFMESLGYNNILTGNTRM
ncbi:hypothetical protein BDR26DRAFT_934298 [Obelidium mucronatum]|nr:hypothetical protein BDR26DRAFT_934298 [Obelidium mucronatum]